MNTAMEIVKRHMDRCGVIGAWELLAETIDDATIKITKERDQLAAQNAILREALLKLKNEVGGLAIKESEIRTLIGNTNWNVLMLRHADADYLLTTPAPAALERSKREAQAGVLEDLCDGSLYQEDANLKAVLRAKAAELRGQR